MLKDRGFWAQLWSADRFEAGRAAWPHLSADHEVGLNPIHTQAIGQPLCASRVIDLFELLRHVPYFVDTNA